MIPRAITALGLAALLAFAVTAAAGGRSGGTPASATASAFAKTNADGVTSGLVRAVGDGSRTSGGSFASASTANYRGLATARSKVTDVRIFGDLATATKVIVSARAADGQTTARGTVHGLVVSGKPVGTVSSPSSQSLGGYGRLVILRSDGTSVTGLQATLTKDYKSFPAGSRVTVAFASAQARDGKAPPPPKQTTEKKPPPKKPPSSTQTTPAAPSKHPKPKRRPAPPTRAQVLATDKHFVFPVFGKYDLADGFTGATPGDLGPGCVGPHEGDDIFANAGTPILAVADGKLEQVGTLPCAGNRLWLRSEKGDRFFYAHLDSFATVVRNGVHVKAGQVIGFVGNTGQAELRPSHLHFEVHPGGGLAVDPYPFLRAWENHRDVPAAAWVKRYSASIGQQPGTLVVVKDFLSR